MVEGKTYLITIKYFNPARYFVALDAKKFFA